MDQENDGNEAPAQMPTTEENNEGAENKSSEKNSMEAENRERKPIKAESSKRPTLKSLKAKSQVKKKSSASVSMVTEKVKGNSVRQNNSRKNKKLSQGNRGGKNNDDENDKNQNSGGGESNDAENDKNQTSRGAKSNDDKNGKDRNSREGNLEKDVTDKEPAGKSQETRKNRERVSGPTRSPNDNGNEENNGGKRKRSRRLDTQGDERMKEKLGGLIFMCNAKTKPDCFHYQVMGVTNNKKDVVLGVRPGLKLFLYDFDLRLMYGIYKASSSGGMRLEPKAFGGSFPVQVRFSVYKDCLPLPESVFKKAIKDNYDKNSKFDTELTIQQTRKLCDLFRPAVFPSVQPTAVVIHSPVRATVWGREIPDKGVARVNSDSRSYPVVSHERDRHRERPPKDLYMSEKEYRTYGLQRERRNLTPPPIFASTVDPYQRDIEREHLYRQPAPPYNETVPLHRESIPADPLYSSQRELQSYNFAGISVLPSAAPSVSAVASGSSVAALDTFTWDQDRAYPYGASSMSEYLLPQRREEVSSGSYYVDGRRDVDLAGSDPLRRRETDEVDRLYLKYSVDPLVDYNHEYRGAKPEATLPPVSSRYSFAGPSVSYR